MIYCGYIVRLLRSPWGVVYIEDIMKTAKTANSVQRLVLVSRNSASHQICCSQRCDQGFLVALLFFHSGNCDLEMLAIFVILLASAKVSPSTLHAIKIISKYSNHPK